MLEGSIRKGHFGGDMLIMSLRSLSQLSDLLTALGTTMQAQDGMGGEAEGMELKVNELAGAVVGTDGNTHAHSWVTNQQTIHAKVHLHTGTLPKAPRGLPPGSFFHSLFPFQLEKLYRKTRL